MTFSRNHPNAKDIQRRFTDRKQIVQPQPAEDPDEWVVQQKTRVRLWARPDGGHIWFCPDKPSNGSWQEIHHDSEGFYTENES